LGKGRFRMVVGRTLWDFIIEVIQTPRLRLWLLALLILLVATIFLMLFLMQNIIPGTRLSYGSVKLEF